MVRIVAGVVILLLTRPALADDDKPKDKPKDKATPAEQYQALVKEYDHAMNVYQMAYNDAMSDEERQKITQEKYPKPEKFAPKFLELAENHPKDSAAVDALIWVLNYTFDSPGGKDSPRAKATALLLRDHVRNDKLGQVCPRMILGFYEESETFLRTTLEKSPHKDVQGQVCLALGKFLNNRLRMFDLVKDRPELAKFYEDLLGKDYFKELQRQDRARAAKEVEVLFERSAEKYADVKFPSGGTVGDMAESELFEIRYLALGKQAPDIEGQDQDGKKFKLSDYHGKVVLLDFWSQF